MNFKNSKEFNKFYLGDFDSASHSKSQRDYYVKMSVCETISYVLLYYSALPLSVTMPKTDVYYR